MVVVILDLFIKPDRADDLTMWLLLLAVGLGAIGMGDS
jgi:hypothetical protein